MEYSLATVRLNARPTAVVESQGHYWSLSQLVPDLLPTTDTRGWMALMDNWPDTEQVLFDRLPALLAANPPLPELDSIDALMAPLLFPGKVCCTGANYRQHLNEVGLSSSFDKHKVRPSFFLKPPRTTVVGSGRCVRYPQQSSQFDWEIELAAVIGRTARNVDSASALQYVAGYTVGIDLSARDYLLHEGNMAGFDTFGGKAFDDSCPLGPRIVPARFISDPQQLALRLKVNGATKQSANTAEMVWTVAEQIAEMSAVMTLEPGDVILTGTPSGAGLLDGKFLKPGDRIVAEIEKIGRLEVEIIPSPWAGSAIPCPLRKGNTHADTL